MNTPVVITVPMWVVWVFLLTWLLLAAWMKAVQVQLRSLYELYKLWADGSTKGKR